MEMILITAKVSYETADFLKKYGTDMCVPLGEVLNRMLVNVSAKSVDEAVKLVLWYYEAITSNNGTEQKIETLYIFTMHCMTLVDETELSHTQCTDCYKITASKNRTDTALKLDVANQTAYVLNKMMSDYNLTQGGAIEKAIDDFLGGNDKVKPYRLINYMISAAQNLMRPQARLTVAMTINTCIDRICQMSNMDREQVISRLHDMKNFALRNKDTAENIQLLKNTAFYKEKLQ